MDYSKEFTINREILFSGIGIHTGRHSEVFLIPSEENSGIIFYKNDAQIPVKPDYVSKSELCTCIKKDNSFVYTIEHLLSALNGLGICNLKIIVNGDEIPILDGSSKIFAEKLKTEIKVQNKNRVFTNLDETVFINSEDKFIIALPSENLEIFYYLDYSKNPPGFMYEKFIYSPGNYINEISPARTFGFYEDLEYLNLKGLALGASYENTLVIKDNDYSNIPRFINEPAKHKVLDLIGDLAFIPNINAKIIAYKTGHLEHFQLVKKITERYS